MIAEERLVSFINSFDSDRGELIEQIGQEARQARVPIIRQEMQSFLEVLIEMKRPMCILEIGTAVGFSAILMSQVMPEGARITTIENYEKRIPVARENIKRAGKENVIMLLEGDAGEIIKNLEGSFDFIFLDGPKGQYLGYLPELVRLLSDGGVLVSDNVLQEGELMESRFIIPRRQRTIHSRMREYLYEIKHHPQLVTSILSLGDGVAVSVKSRESRQGDII